MSVSALAFRRVPAPTTRGQIPPPSGCAGAAGTNQPQPRRGSAGTSFQHRRRESSIQGSIEGPRHEAGVPPASAAPGRRELQGLSATNHASSTEPAATGAEQTSAAVENLSTGEARDHRLPGPCHATGGEGDAATDAEVKEWDSPEQISVAMEYLAALEDTETGAQPPWERPEDICVALEYLASERDAQTGIQQPPGAAAAAAELGPVASAAATAAAATDAAAAENPTASSAPLSAEGACELAARGVAGQEAGTHVEPPRAVVVAAAAAIAAAVARPKVTQLPPAVNGSSNSASAACEGGLNAPRATGPEDTAGAHAVAREARVGVQAGEAEAMRISPRGNGLFDRAGGSGNSRRGGAEGALKSIEEDAATAGPIERPAVGSEKKEEDRGTGVGGPVADATQPPPLNLVDGGYTVVLIDVETTGYDPEIHRVIELAAKVRRRRSSLCWVAPSSTRLTGGSVDAFSRSHRLYSHGGGQVVIACTSFLVIGSLLKACWCE